MRKSEGAAPQLTDRGYTIVAQIACVKREIAMRERVYPKWVLSGRMKAETADHEVSCLKAVLGTLIGLQVDGRL